MQIIRRRKTLISLAFLPFILFASSASFAEEQITIPKPLTLAWINEQIKSYGARYVVYFLWEQNRYDNFTDQIASGQSEWIALAPQIAPGTDAAPAEELGISLAYALPKNPEAVLSVIDDLMIPISTQIVCSAPFIEDTVKEIPKYIDQSKAALEKIKSKKLIESEDKMPRGVGKSINTDKIS